MPEYSSTENIVAPATAQFASPQSKNQKNDIIKRTIQGVIVALIYAHFAWATYYFVEKTDDTLDATTCTGYGFWMILFIFINYGLLHSFVLKKYCFPHLSSLWKQIVRIFWRVVPKNLQAVVKKYEVSCLSSSSFFKFAFRYGGTILRGVILVAILAFIISDSRDDWWRLMPLVGLAVYMALGFLLSPCKRKIPWDTVLSGLIAQFALGLLMIRWEVGRNIFSCVGDKVDTFLHYAVNASAFVYGDDLVLDQAIFAFNALAAIYFMNFLINILYYYEIMQAIVLNLGLFLQWLLGTPICESVNSAANIFLGMVIRKSTLGRFFDIRFRASLPSC
jgi:pyrimidine nucleoside transport protein